MSAKLASRNACNNHHLINHDQHPNLCVLLCQHVTVDDKSELLVVRCIWIAIDACRVVERLCLEQEDVGLRDACGVIQIGEEGCRDGR